MSKLGLVKIYDTTLRDGSQAEDIAFSVEDKIRIAQKLDELGIHYVEGGWPGSNPKDWQFFEGINIQMISTSEIKISCIIDSKYTELAVRALHDAFELDKPAITEEK